MRDGWISDDPASSPLALACKKENCGLPLRWMPAVMDMCTKLYEQAQETSSAKLSIPVCDELLTLVTLQWLCLVTHQESYADAVEQCISTAEWLCSSLVRVVKKGSKSSKANDIDHLEKTTIPGFTTRLVQVINRTGSCPADAELKRTMPSLRAAMVPLAQRMMKYLAKQLDIPLPLPNSWIFPDRLSCSCDHCTRYQRFLESPTEREMVFKITQKERDHVRCALSNPLLSCETIRVGGPHQLRIRKTQSALSQFEQKRKKLQELSTRLEPVLKVLKRRLTRAISLASHASSVSSGAPLTLPTVPSPTRLTNSTSSMSSSTATDGDSQIVLPMASGSNVPSLPFMSHRAAFASPSSHSLSQLSAVDIAGHEAGASLVHTSSSSAVNASVAVTIQPASMSGQKRPREESEFDN